MRKTRHILVLALAAVTLAACTGDDLAPSATDLPRGAYPLRIGGISISQPTERGEDAPLTRVSESANGMGSVFQDGDRIGVRIDGSDETGVYELRVDDRGSIIGVTPVKPVYWTSSQPRTINAWYPVDSEIDFTHQDKGLAYLLKGTSDALVSYDGDLAEFTFTHQLAKVRVTLSGERADDVEAVTVRCHPKAANAQGTLGAPSGSPTYVPMLPATYNGQRCWEATLRGGTLQAGDSFRLTPEGKGDPVQATLEMNVPIEAGNVYTFTIAAKPYPDGAKEVTSAISDNGNYKVEGNRATSITITGGSPHIYLYGATVSVGSGPAISITGNASPTIHVVGDNAVRCTGSSAGQEGAGIYVAESSSVTIQGSGRNDVLRAEAGTDGAGIGGYRFDYSYLPCGDITINNVTVYAYSEYNISISPGIGSYESCGTITIGNATVYARGTAQATEGCPAIGSYYSVPTIRISGSDIYAYRGAYTNGTSYADWIGQGGIAYDGRSGAIQGDIRSTTVNKGKWTGSSEISEGKVVYDADGVVTEQSQ